MWEVSLSAAGALCGADGEVASLHSGDAQTGVGEHGTGHGTSPLSEPRVKPRQLRWEGICDTFEDVFGTPGAPQERAIKHRIDLVDPKQPVHHHRQYRMSQDELREVRE